MTFFCKPHRSPRSGQGHTMDHEVKVKPQVHLTFMPEGHPVLDLGDKQRSASFSWPGHMWSRVTSMFSSPPPVQWVNQHLVTDNLQQYTLMPAPPTFHASVGGNLWHPAPPGGINQQMVMMDPQNMLSYNILPPKQDNMGVYPTCWKSTKTLNPDAQEWVPKEYRNTTTATATTTSATTTSSNGYGEDKGPYLMPTTPYTSTATTTITTSPVQECRNTTNTTTNGYIGDKREYLTPTTPHTSATTTTTPETPFQKSISTSETHTESPQYIQSPRSSSRNNRMSPEDPKLTSDCSASQATTSGTTNLSPQSRLKSGSPKNNTSARMSPKSQQSPSQTKNVTSGSQGSPNSTSVSLQSTSKCLQNQINTPETKKQDPECSQSQKNTFEINQMNPETLQPNPLIAITRISSEINLSPSNLALPTISQCQGSATLPSMALSYAGVLGRASPSPPPPPDTQELKYKGVQQPLPKIFQGDKAIVRDDVVEAKEERRSCSLFRKPNKSQRTRARFLKDLKEATGANCGSSVSCSSSDLPSSSPPCPSKLMSPNVSSSPDSSTSPCASKTTSPSNPTIPASNSNPTSTHPVLSTLSLPTQSVPAQKLPSAPTPPIPIPATPCCTFPVLSPAAESPNHVRLSSESSVGSLDIEFVEQDEVDRAIQTAGTPAQPRGIRNSFLACILGSGDSESEEEDEDEDESDWDEVCGEDQKEDLDDSWETFGIGLVVVSRPMPTVPDQKCQGNFEAPDHEETSDAFRDINERWNEEIGKDVRGRSEPRVKFGSVKVHPMVVWGHAYRQARRGPWEQQARDRARFGERVSNLEPILSKILDPGHRGRVYQRLNGPKPSCDRVL